MSTQNNMRQALERLLGKDPLLPLLVTVLTRCQRQAGIFFHEIDRLADDATADLLLLAWDWKLLLPRRCRQCGEWDDRVMRFEADECYEMLNIVRSLLDIASQTGFWDTDAAVEALYLEMGEPEYGKMPGLVREIIKSAGHTNIDATAIHDACVRTGLGERTDTMIAILKGGGLISPKLLSVSPMDKRHSPVYEFHPAVGQPGL